MKEEEFFENYTNKYDKNLDGIYLKYYHSYRVVEKSLRIANTLNLNKKDMHLVRVCGLFHDIARFEQYTNYKSFDDRKSFDHGDKGVEILKENGYKNRIVLNAVEYHNKIKIPSYLDNRSKLFLRIVRDADKVDIMEHQGLKCTTENYTIPDEIIDYFKKHKSIGGKIKEVPPGNLIGILRMMAFIYDINYKESFRMIKELDLINKKCDLIKDYGNKRIDEIRKLCNEYIESRLK